MAGVSHSQNLTPSAAQARFQTHCTAAQNPCGNNESGGQLDYTASRADWDFEIRGARQEGVEPPTHGLEGRCSVPLSYWRSSHASRPANPCAKSG